jgi:hypothetical protein
MGRYPAERESVTIQIDDANYGGLVGTCLVGIVRVEDVSTFRSVELPIESFQGTAYEKNRYLEEAATACLRLLRDLKVLPSEPIHLCRGWVFEKAEPALREADYDVRRGKIGEPMQSLVESAAADYLGSIGVKGIAPGMPFGSHFFACLRWLKGGNPNSRALPERERLAKTGWPSYRVWATLPVTRARIEAARIKAARKRSKRGSYFGDDDE